MAESTPVVLEFPQEMKPCPLCGGGVNASYRVNVIPLTADYMLACMCGLHSVLFKDLNDLCTWWNRRDGVAAEAPEEVVVEHPQRVNVGSGEMRPVQSAARF